MRAFRHPAGNDTGRQSPASARVAAGLRRRYAAERRFRLYGQTAVLLGLASLATLFLTIAGKGYSAFFQTEIQLDITFDPEVIDPEDLAASNFRLLVKRALRQQFPQVRSRNDLRQLNKLVSSGAPFLLQEAIRRDPGLLATTVPVWLPADDDVDMLCKGRIDRNQPSGERRLSDRQIRWIDDLQARGRIAQRFNWRFFTASDSREPELAGIRGAVVGSVLTLSLTLLLSFPIGVAAAIYLEEFSPRNRWTDLIEININNLAAVPSIVFGLLGLAVFLNFFHLPRSSSLAGGLVLALMTLPTIIIASRASLKAVPPSIREAALGIGASRMQTVLHHVLPLALPGILTGSIIGMAQALGETAPLLMIGMVAFIVDVPTGFLDPATSLPVQIYLWADSPERAFVERTSAAILVLLFLLVTMNAAAIWLRKRYEKQW